MRTADLWTRRGERGAAALLLSLFIAALMIPLGALAVDVARWWVEAERLQAAADAASTAGVTHMPEDFNLARARALEIAEDNGYKHGANADIEVGLGDRPTQLRVTISSDVTNIFGGILGRPSSAISRGAMADFNGPAPMGSPCNLFGNEPAGTPLTGPTSSVLKAASPAICSSTPQFWGSISGPEVPKDQGSQFEARKCWGNEDGCASSAKGAVNKEFEPRGYVFMVRVTQAAVGLPVKLQLFDPAYVATDALCPSTPSGSTTLSNNWNDHVNDATSRYRTGVGTFCTGDDSSESRRFTGQSANPTVTSFGLRAPVNTLNPYEAPPVPGCVKQFPGYNKNSVTRNALRKGNNSYNDQLARVFRQWVTLCTFTPTEAGDYYLQIRTNVPTGGTFDALTGTWSNNQAVYTAGDNASMQGNGVNNFGIRAESAAPGGAVSVAAWERMRMFANANAAQSEFNLVRVAPAAATKNLVVTFFDVGEGASNGTVKLLAPSDSSLAGRTITGCLASGVANKTLTNCELTGLNSNSYNGRLQTIKVPIPNTYTCLSTSPGGCWWRVRVSFGSGSVNDSTTWTAKIDGEPVRLIE